jgi:hypothetical protein
MSLARLTGHIGGDVVNGFAAHEVGQGDQVWSRGAAYL